MDPISESIHITLPRVRLDDRSIHALDVQGCLVELIDKPLDRAAMGEGARARVTTHFSLSQSVSATVQLLSKLAQKQGESSRRVSAVVNGTKPSAVHGLNGVLAEQDKAAAG